MQQNLSKLVGIDTTKHTILPLGLSHSPLAALRTDAGAPSLGLTEPRSLTFKSSSMRGKDHLCGILQDEKMTSLSFTGSMSMNSSQEGYSRSWPPASFFQPLFRYTIAVTRRESTVSSESMWMGKHPPPPENAKQICQTHTAHVPLRRQIG